MRLARRGVLPFAAIHPRFIRSCSSTADRKGTSEEVGTVSLGTIITLGLVVFVAGMVGGAIDAYRTRNTTLLPDASASIPEGAPVAVSEKELKRPGLLYSVLIGGAAALLSWALYGPLAQINLLDVGAAGGDYAMTLAAVGGAVFVGMGGARWISAEADKRILQTSGTMALASKSSPDAARQYSATASPATALDIAAEAYETAPAAGPPAGG